jgi:hypothetical protein
VHVDLVAEYEVDVLVCEHILSVYSIVGTVDVIPHVLVLS